VLGIHDEADAPTAARVNRAKILDRTLEGIVVPLRCYHVLRDRSVLGEHEDPALPGRAFAAQTVLSCAVSHPHDTTGLCTRQVAREVRAVMRRSDGRVPSRLRCLQGLAVALSILAGVMTALITLASGHAPAGTGQAVTQSAVLASTGGLQVLVTCRARDASFTWFLVVSVAGAVFAVVLGLAGLAIGITVAWAAWLFNVDASAREALLGWLALGPGVAATARLVRRRALR
jgi:hypothetical protein